MTPKIRETIMSTSSIPQAALYCQGSFSTANPTPAQRKQMIDLAKDIGNSGFTTVILGQFHVHPDGTVYYNDSPLDTVLSTLAIIPTLLKRAGKVRKVLVTFGPFGSDFSAMQSNLASFKTTMADLLSSCRIDGFDWDVEESLDSFTGLLTDLTTWAHGLGYSVTAAPYYDSTFWTTVLQQVHKKGASFAWWNLQLYGGASYPSWVQALSGKVNQPAAFLYPGYSNNQGATPTSIFSNLQALKSSYPALTGGFLWRYESIAGSGFTTAQFAQAILNGVSSRRQTDEIENTDDGHAATAASAGAQTEGVPPSASF